MLSVYRHGVACALFFANAVLNVSPNLVRQSSILLLDRRSKVVEPCGAHCSVAIDARDAGTLEDIQSMLDSRYFVASGTCVIPFPLQAQRRGDVLPVGTFLASQLFFKLWQVTLLELMRCIRHRFFVARALLAVQSFFFLCRGAARQRIPRPPLSGELREPNALGVRVAGSLRRALLNSPPLGAESFVECGWTLDMLQVLALEPSPLIAPVFLRAYDVEPQTYLGQCHRTRLTVRYVLAPVARRSNERIEDPLRSQIARTCPFAHERSIGERLLLAR